MTKVLQSVPSAKVLRSTPSAKVLTSVAAGKVLISTASAGAITTRLGADPNRMFYLPLAEGGGVVAQVAKAAAAPTVETRASQAARRYLGAADALQVAHVANNVMRLDTVLDGASARVSGLRSQEARTNVFPYTEDVASWTSNGGANVTITANTATAPDGTTTADKADFTGVDEIYNRCLNANGGASVNGIKFSFGFYARRLSGGTQVYVGATDATTWAGQTQNAVTVPDTWSLVTGSVTTNAPSASTTADLVFGTLGHGNPNLGAIEFEVWGVTLERADFPSSYIPMPSTTQITRVKDELRYEGNANVAGPAIVQQSVRADVLIDNGGHLGGTVWDIADAAAPTHRVRLTIEPTTGLPRVRTAAGAGAAGDVTGTTDVSDGNKHTIWTTLEANSLKLYVDDTQEGGEDITVALPTGLDEFAVGADVAGNNQLNGIVDLVDVYDDIRSA